MKTNIRLNKKMLLWVTITIGLFASCKKTEIPESNLIGETSSNAMLNKNASQFSADVIDKWITMQLRLDRNAVGIPNVAFARYYAYSGVAALAALAPGMASNAINIAGRLNGLNNLMQPNLSLAFYWPASVNSALAYINRRMFLTASTADKTAIDSLETALNNEYLSHHNHQTIARSDSFGVLIATQVFNWSETDGYKNASNPYTPPTGPGLWVPTPPFYAPATEPYWGNLRPVIAGSIDNTQPGPPITYSEIKGSDFYKMVNHVHYISKHLTHADSIQALFWRDVPGYTTAGHWLSILQQVLTQKNTPLDKAALAYALTGAALNDASISVWQTKYHYNQLRPITYIINVIGDAGWLPLLTTPAHPEYSSAHCVISTATTKMFLAVFGNIGSFTDHSYDYLGLGPRTFTHFSDIPQDVAKARVLAGIHFRPSCDSGMVQGRKVAANILRIIGMQ